MLYMLPPVLLLTPSQETFMPDHFGPQGVFALFIPLQNANMQPEYEMLRPIVPANIATYWYALRRHGTSDVPDGFGQLAKKTEIAD
jgi:hypothetical protein